MVRAERGTHFDPKLSDLFLEHREDVAAIFVDYPDKQAPESLP